jgi:hypothetical protein
MFLASIGLLQSAGTWPPRQVGREACPQAVGEEPKLTDPTKEPRRQLTPVLDTDTQAEPSRAGSLRPGRDAAVLLCRSTQLVNRRRDLLQMLDQPLKVGRHGLFQNLRADTMKLREIANLKAFSCCTNHAFRRSSIGRHSSSASLVRSE